MEELKLIYINRSILKLLRMRTNSEELISMIEEGIFG